ncbi:MAG: peptidoglycan DD-metalloendopeptidase family protein [Neorhizobium sp.]|nr:peptidoglycan DD-metalloendopeptidase family protein [Neorhizobium sp.]
MSAKSSSKVGISVVKFAAAALLASAATGCSSDASRFSGLFSKSDTMTTASIPQRQGGSAYGQPPIPRDDLGGSRPAMASSNGGYNNGGYNGGGYNNNGGYNNRQAAMAQPYPGNNGGYTSPARSSVEPVAVQRQELSPPSASSARRTMASAPLARDPASRQEAMAQPFPGRQAAAPALAAPARQPARADNVVTGSTPRQMSGWSTVNAPHVTLRPGETATTLANRYGVPEREILKANGGSIAAGQQVIIPTFGTAPNSAKTASADIDLHNKAPMPSHEPEQKVAVLPTPSRDKGMAEPAKLTPPGGKPMGGSYVVKPGDTLAKIAHATGTPIDQLKAANGLATGQVRVGQALKVNHGIQEQDQTQTASIPARPAAQPAPAAAPKVAAAPAQPVSAPASAKPAAETASLSDVEKKGDNSAAPQSTGIGKYRWPVSGAVIAGYGANVNGSRNDGIDISVPEGTPIKAAENGVVIYAGNGLKQLGNTVLVRHDDGRVTVYGHAESINVARGQKVTRGQTVALSGMSGDASRPQVHFEVRKDATPVNPVTYLE